MYFLFFLPASPSIFLHHEDDEYDGNINMDYTYNGHDNDIYDDDNGGDNDDDDDDNDDNNWSYYDCLAAQ